MTVATLPNQTMPKARLHLTLMVGTAVMSVGSLVFGLMTLQNIFG